MAYLPPFNGGRINATISGNTAGAGSLVSSGTLTFAGGNNITLSQAGNAISISGPNISNISATGALSISSNGNTVSMGVAMLTAGVMGTGAGGSTSGTNGANSNGLALYAGSNLTLSQSTGANGASVTLMAGGGGGGGGGIALYDGTSSISSGTARISASGALTASVSGQTLNLSAPAQSNLSATGIVSISSNGNTISIGAPAFSVGIASNSTVSNQVIFAAGTNITLSQSTNASGATISIAGASGGGGGGGGVALVNGTATYSSGSVNLNASGGLTLSNLGGQTLNLSAPAQSNLSATGIVSISSNGNTISIGAPAFSVGIASNSTVSNQVIFAAGTNITLSQSTNASGATISIAGASGGGGGGGGVATLSNWEPLPLQYGSLSYTQKGDGSVYLYKLQPAVNVVASRLLQLVSITVTTSSNVSHAGAISIAAGIFSANGSTLSLITESSGSTYYQWTNTSNASLSVLSGIQGLSMPIGISMTPGNYWIGMWSRTTYTNANSFRASNIVFAANNSVYQGLLLQSSNASQGVQEGVGYYSASSSALPSNIAMSDITQSRFRSNAMPYIIFKNMTW